MAGQVATILSGLVALGAMYYSGLPARALEPLADRAAIKLHTMENGAFIENVWARPNGELLLTSLQHAHIFAYNPATPAIAPRIFARIEIGSGEVPVNGISGIAPIPSNNGGAETYAVIGADWKLHDFEGRDTRIFTFDASSVSKKDKTGVLPATKLVTLPADAFGNGMIQHPFVPSQLLVADSYKGGVWRVDTVTGQTDMLLEDETMRPAKNGPPGKVPLGINGIRYSHGHLYWTNSNKGLLCAKPVDWDARSAGGSADGATRIVARAGPEQAAIDDFVMGETGIDRDYDGTPSSNVWIASHHNSLLKVDSQGRQRIAVGGGNTTILGTRVGPTAVTWGRGSERSERTLYVVGGDGDITAVDTKVLRCEAAGGRMYFGRFCIGSRHLRDEGW